MGNRTRERILEAALVSFANDGYKGTNLRDLAAGLGLSKSALYRHFDSKDAIWNAVLDNMEAYYSEHFGAPENPAQIPESCQELAEAALRQIDFTLHDSKVVLTRRFLLREQFHDERVRNYATRHFLIATRDIYTGIFTGMMEKGLLRKDDPAMLAFTFTAPVSALIQLCDREPEREPEIRLEIKEFVEYFIRTHKA